jgi:predicted dehydrogenase
MTADFPSPSHPIRVGVIGAGNWALHGHLRVLALLPEYTVTAIQSRRQEAAEAAAKQFGIAHVATSAGELVQREDVDLVLVLTTAPQHEEGVRAALEAGKDVYCEWPLTTDTDTSRELMALADAKGRRHLAGLQRRLAPANRFVRDLLEQGYVGKVRSVRLHVSMNYFQATRTVGLHWTVPPENFSSVVAIYAGHFLDALFSVVGIPESFSALTVNQFPVVTIRETGDVFETTTPDQLLMSGTLAGGGVFSVHIEGGKRNGSGVQIDITGDEGDLKITNTSAFGGEADNYIITGAHGDNLPLEVLEVPESYNWLPPSSLPSAVLELANLYAAHARDVREGTHEAPTFATAIRMHELLDLVEASTELGERVHQS